MSIHVTIICTIHAPSLSLSSLSDAFLFSLFPFTSCPVIGDVFHAFQISLQEMIISAAWSSRTSKITWVDDGVVGKSSKGRGGDWLEGW